MLIFFSSILRMEVGLEHILNALTVSMGAFGIESFTDILPNLPCDEKLTGGYARRDFAALRSGNYK